MYTFFFSFFFFFKLKQYKRGLDYYTFISFWGWMFYSLKYKWQTKEAILTLSLLIFLFPDRKLPFFVF
jgi:hypothetical protein